MIESPSHWRCILVFFTLGAFLGGEVGHADERKKEMEVHNWAGKYPVMVVAHRGFSGAAPENTLAAFRKGIEIGSDMIELDIHLSSDGRIVVVHDETLERTTNGRGRVADLSFEELKRLDAGSKFGPEFSGERIPAFEEVLAVAKGRVFVNIEIKNPSHGKYSITKLTERAVGEVKRAGMSHRVIFSSFNPASLEWIKKNEPGLQVALLYHRPWEVLSEVTGGKEYKILNLRNLYLTRDKIGTIHREGMKVNVYTVNSEEELKQFVTWGADGIITNYPDRLIRILQGK
jgi:glycerophosphoryl diester phosphodiesterase